MGHQPVFTPWCSHYSRQKTLHHHSGSTALLQKHAGLFEMSDCNSVKTPLPQNVQLFTPTVEDSVEIETYCTAVGMLNFLAIQTQPDISFSVSYLARFNPCHNKSHWMAAKHLLRFFKGSVKAGLTFGQAKAKNKTVEGYADADYAGDVNTRQQQLALCYTSRVLLSCGRAAGSTLSRS